MYLRIRLAYDKEEWLCTMFMKNQHSKLTIEKELIMDRFKIAGQLNKQYDLA